MLQSADKISSKKWILCVEGCVQGVGFRPFVYRLAKKYCLAGYVQNTSTGVYIEVQAEEESLICFKNELLSSKPEKAVIADITIEETEASDASDFIIKESICSEQTTLCLLSDTAMCHLCFEEFSDPSNRRYLYPFIHCMSCGPRFSLFEKMPFDRIHTTMKDFAMCTECQQEYTSPESRRFFSQTNCCPSCGPALKLLDKEQNLIAQGYQAIEASLEHLKNGKIVAVKNTGGFLLLTDARSSDSVQTLRDRKKRGSKPFALLISNIEKAKHIAYIDKAQEDILTSPAAPIVLLKKKEDISLIAPNVCSESPYLGIMLASNALLHLLCQVDIPLVATSGNIAGHPLCITDEAAYTELDQCADFFLTHNRRIRNRIDDSVVHVMDGKKMMMRRGRGYVPSMFKTPEGYVFDTPSFASGSHLKNSFAIGYKDRIYLSQHIGDLDSVAAYQSYQDSVSDWTHLLQTCPEHGVSDTHPDLLTGRFIEKNYKNRSSLQHHRAHVLSAMIDTSVTRQCLAIVWDGTGIGDDRSIWGAETFIADMEKVEHFASILPFKLAGAEVAVKEPRRACLGLLFATYEERISNLFDLLKEIGFLSIDWQLLIQCLQKNINAPICTSMGRLFDAISSLLGLCHINEFEGHAAIRLEALAYQAPSHQIKYDTPLIFDQGLWRMDYRPMVRQIVSDKNDIPHSIIADAFHAAIAEYAVKIAQKAGLKDILLSGGVMQNKVLVEKIVTGLKHAGYCPHLHQHTPPNDGGIATGQLLSLVKKTV